MTPTNVVPPTYGVPSAGSDPYRVHTGTTVGTSSAYPSRNFNRQIKLGVQTAILVRVHFPDDPNGQVTWPPDDQTAQATFDAVKLLSENNAYQRGFSVEFQPNLTTGENSKYFEIELPGAVPSAFGLKHFLDAIAAFGAKYPSHTIHAYDRVMFLTPMLDLPPLEGGAYAQASGMYTQFTQDGAWALAPNAMAAADYAPSVLHEMFHGYRFAHANTFDAVRGCEDEDLCMTQYGDTYDFMGDISYLGWRYHAECYPSQVLPTFAASTEVHLNPIHKWQLGWLDDADIRIIQPGEVTAIPLAGITATTGVRAILIERGLDANGAPISVLIYWRNNEPPISNGVCIAYVSREQQQVDTRMLDFVNSPLSTTNCYEMGDPIPLRPSWPVGITWSETTVTVARIRCPNPPANGVLMVEIDNSAQDGRPLAGLPILEMSSPILQSGKVITNDDQIVIYVTATVPDLDPNREGWQGIDHMEVAFLQGEGSAQGPVYFDDGSIFPLPEATCADLRSPTTLSLRASQLRAAQSSSANPIPLRKVLGVRVVAVTNDNKRLANTLQFLIDQTIGAGT